MGLPAQRHQSVKWLDFSLQDQDSSSTQSTNDSYTADASIRENALDCQRLCFAKSGDNVTDMKGDKANHQLLVPTGTQNFIFPHLQADHYQSFPQLPAPLADQHFNTVLTTYGPQAMAMGVTPGRVPLPLELAASEPVFVNAKQYRGILRRRQQRAKLEAQNKIVKNRKPYLHESRHQHALKRARGSGGRFLNLKKLQASDPAQPTHGHNASSSISLHMGVGKVSDSQVHYKEGNSANSGSDVTSDYIYHPVEFGFLSYSPCMAGPTMHGGGDGNYI